MKKIYVAILTLVLTISSFADKIIQIKGSDTILSASQSIAENYMLSHKNARIAVVGGGSGVGITSLINGNNDIALSSRDIKKSEIEGATKRGLKLKEVTIGFDGITIVSNKENNIDNISSSDLGKIYRGEITNWKEVGGVDAEIVVLSRDSSSGTHEFFKEHIVRGGNSKGKQEYGPKTLYMPSNEAIKQELLANKNAIGYMGMGYVDSSIKSLNVDNISPTMDNVLSKKYGISRAVYWIIYEDANPKIQEIVDYALSPEGQEIVKAEGFVPVK